MATGLELDVQRKLLDVIGKNKRTIEGILAKQIDPDRFARLIVGEIRRNPEIAACSPSSVVNAVITAAAMGLEIRAGSAYLVPFARKGQAHKECTLLIDYRGKADMAMRSGRVEAIDAEVVYGADEIEVSVDTDGQSIRRIKHVPKLWKQEGDLKVPITEQERGQRLGVYGLAKITVGGFKGVFLPTYEVEKIKARSKARDSGPWVTDEPEMWKKTAVHRLCKLLPQTPELAASQEVDDAYETGTALVDVIDVDLDEPLVHQSAKMAAEIRDKKIAELEENVSKLERQGIPAAAAPGVSGLGASVAAIIGGVGGLRPGELAKPPSASIPEVAELPDPVDPAYERYEYVSKGGVAYRRNPDNTAWNRLEPEPAPAPPPAKPQFGGLRRPK